MGLSSLTTQKGIQYRMLLLALLLAVGSIAERVAAQLPGWSYLAPIRITNKALMRTYDFQQMIIVNTKGLIDAKQLKADGSDLRFGKDQTGSVLYPYYIESGINTTTTRIWVKLDVMVPNTTTTFYMFYGNKSATVGSTLKTFYGPYSTTDSTTSSNPGTSVGKVHRGFSFTPLKNMLVAGLGKRIPTSTTNTVTLFDYSTRDQLERVQVGGSAGAYNYTPLPAIRWLSAGTPYVLDVFIENGSYYQDVPTRINKYISFMQLQYCNNCGVDDFPAQTLGYFNTGYPDMHFYLKNDTIAQQTYTVGPFLTVTPDTLQHAVYQEPFSETLVAKDGTPGYTFELIGGALPPGITLASNGTISGATSSPGSYTFSVKVTDESSINGMPVTTIRTYTLVVDRMRQVIVIDAIPEHAYGDAPFNITATSSAGLPVKVIVNSGPAVIDGNKITLTGAGSVMLEASQPGDNYYGPATVYYSFPVSPKALTIKVDDKTRPYGNANPVFTVSYEGLINGDVIENLKVATTATVGSPVGTYPLTATHDENLSYVITVQEGKLTVTKRNITVAISALPAIRKVYDGNTTATLVKDHYIVTGLVNGDTLLLTGSAAYENANVGTGKKINVTGFTGAGIAADNYTLAATTATTVGDITVKDVTLALNSSPAVTKEYDGTNTAALAPANYQLAGAIPGDDVTVACKGYYSTSTVGRNKTVNLSDFVLSGASKGNYKLFADNATLAGEITPRSLKVLLLAVPAVAKVYDGNNTAALLPANYSLTGVIGSEKVTINTPATGKFEDIHVGTNKKVTAEGVVLSGADATNYVLSPAVATGDIGTIAKTGVAVMADGGSKLYGAEDGVLTYKTTGLIGTDVLTGTLSREAGENVGTYKIQQGTLSGQNYFIAGFTPADFSIKPAVVTVTANDKERAQGQTNPEFTAYFTGFMSGDDSTKLTSPLVLQTSANAASMVGTYDIIPSGAAAPNYTFEYVNGKLTVLPGAGKVRVWTSSRNTMQVRIYSEISQKASIVMYTEAGQRVLYRQEQLNPGMNIFPYSIGQLPSAFYVVNIQGEDIKEAHKLNIR